MPLQLAASSGVAHTAIDIRWHASQQMAIKTVDSQGPNAGAEQQTRGVWAAKWGLLLRMARQVAGLSLNELAERSGLSKGYLSKLESAHPSAANPSRATLAALVRALPSTLPLIQHLDPDDGLPTPATLLSDERSRAAQRSPNQPIVSSASLPRLSGTVSQEDLLTWAKWEVILVLSVLENSGLGPPTEPVLARACSREAIDPGLLSTLEREDLLRRIPPDRPGGATRYTQGAMRLHQLGIQRPADFFMRAAISMLLRTGIEDEQSTSFHARTASADPEVR